MIDQGGHSWRTVSRHPTSDGVVAYQRCHCGIWRVVLGIENVVAARVGQWTVTTRPPSTSRS